MTVLTDYIKNMQIIDTHEHIPPEEDWLNKKLDFSQMLCYIGTDAISAGLSQHDWERIIDPEEKDINAKWQIFKPYWKIIRNTAYSKSLLVALRDLYDIDDLTDSTIPVLTEKLSKVQRKGYYREILKDRSKIVKAILNTNIRMDKDFDPEFFTSTINTSAICHPEHPNWLGWIEESSDMNITNLESFICAVDTLIERQLNRGSIGFKWAMAYWRKIEHNDVTKHDAEQSFNDYVITYPKSQFAAVSPKEWKPFQDYCFHHIIQLSIDYNLPVQIHTGILADNITPVTNSKPTYLINLFLKYPKARFDIFHGGYPYTNELGVLAKNFPNVYIDMCWMHIISPTASINALKEWLETIPVNKIFGFGGDHAIVEGAYAHSLIARNNISRALSDMVCDGYFTEAEAVDIAQKILYNNPGDFYRLDI